MNTVNLRSFLANYKELHVVQSNTHTRTSQNTDSASTFLRQPCYIIHYLTSQATLINLPSDAPSPVYFFHWKSSHRFSNRWWWHRRCHVPLEAVALEDIFWKDDKLHRRLFLLLRCSIVWFQPWSSTMMLIAPGLVKLGMWSCSGGFGCRMVIQKIQRGCCSLGVALHVWMHRWHDESGWGGVGAATLMERWRLAIKSRSGYLLLCQWWSWVLDRGIGCGPHRKSKLLGQWCKDLGNDDQRWTLSFVACSAWVVWVRPT